MGGLRVSVLHNYVRKNIEGHRSFYYFNSFFLLSSAYSKLNEDVIDFVYVSESNKNGNRSNSSSNVTRVVFREKAPGSSLVSVNDGRFVETPVNHPTTTRSGAPSWALLSSVSTHFEGPAGLFLPTILSRGVVIVRTLPHGDE